MVWKQSRTIITLFLARAFCFFWAYFYHDWQSVVPLFWLCHSFVFADSLLFKKFMLYLYLPAFTLVFLWYYIINIFGLISWPTDPA